MRRFPFLVLVAAIGIAVDPAAAQQPGYIDVQMMKLRSALQGSAPARIAGARIA